MAALTDEEIEQLIGEVEKYPHLYILRRGDYKDALKKKNSWETISKTMNLEGWNGGEHK